LALIDLTRVLISFPGQPVIEDKLSRHLRDYTWAFDVDNTTLKMSDFGAALEGMVVGEASTREVNIVILCEHDRLDEAKQVELPKIRGMQARTRTGVVRPMMMKLSGAAAVQSKSSRPLPEVCRAMASFTRSVNEIAV
jgi:hypothetical protein